MKPLGTLLLVDDDRHILASMGDWLRQQNYAVDAASTLAEGIAAVDRKSYDLALVDVRLGRKTGSSCWRTAARRIPTSPWS